MHKCLPEADNFKEYLMVQLKISWSIMNLLCRADLPYYTMDVSQLILHYRTYLPSTTSTDLLDGPQYITHLIFSSGPECRLSTTLELDFIDA